MGKPGKSAGLRHLMENDDDSHDTMALSSVDSTCTAASGRFFTMSTMSFPGRTVSPSSSTSAVVVYWMESSRSVVWNVTSSPRACTNTPESTGSVDLLVIPFCTMTRALRNSL